jgi:hypothetical protein
MQNFDFTNVLLLEVQLFVITVWKSKKKKYQVGMQTQARQYQLLTLGTFRFFYCKILPKFGVFLKTFRNTY